MNPSFVSICVMYIYLCFVYFLNDDIHIITKITTVCCGHCYWLHLVPVVGAVVAEVAIVHTPGVEPLELSVVVVLMELVVVLLLRPINISGLGGKSAILCSKLLLLQMPSTLSH